jgi:hypothetical protein
MKSLGFGVHRREMLHQQAVDKDVPAADTAEEDNVGAVVEEGKGAEEKMFFAGNE